MWLSLEVAQKVCSLIFLAARITKWKLVSTPIVNADIATRQNSISEGNFQFTLWNQIYPFCQNFQTDFVLMIHPNSTDKSWLNLYITKQNPYEGDLTRNLISCGTIDLSSAYCKGFPKRHRVPRNRFIPKLKKKKKFNNKHERNH